MGLLDNGIPNVLLKTMRTVAQLTGEYFFGESGLIYSINGDFILIIVLNDEI